MKIGTVIFVGLIVIFFAGFMFSNSIQLKADFDELQANLISEQNEKHALQAQIQNLSTAYQTQQTVLTETQSENEALHNQVETLSVRLEEAQTKILQTQQAHDQLQAICTQTNPLAASLVAMIGLERTHKLNEMALPGLFILFLAITGASGGGWYWWHHSHHLPFTPQLPPLPHDQIWVRMTRQQARQFAHSQRYGGKP